MGLILKYAAQILTLTQNGHGRSECNRVKWAVTLLAQSHIKRPGQHLMSAVGI